jgi:hypothetical protein
MDFAKLLAKIDSIESKQSLNEGWEDMMKSVDKDGKEKEKEKGTGKFDKKETSTGTVYTRKSSTFDDGGDDSDTKKAKDKAKKAKKSKTDESVEEDLDEAWGAGLDALERIDVEQALSALKKYAPDAKVGPGHITAGNTEVAVSNDDKVSLADLNKAVRTLKGVSANTLRRVQEEDVEEGIEDRIGSDLEAETDPAKQTSFNTPAVQRQAQSGDTAANDTMNRLRKLAGQPPKMEPEEQVEEDDVEEGAGVMHFKAQQAKADGKDSFKLGDKTYPVKESAAPGQEDWIKSNKEKFIKQYGKEKGEEVLYATAWKRSKAVKESRELEECYDQAMAEQPEQESGMNINSNIDTKTGNKSLTVTAQGAAAEELAQILKLSGMHAHEEETMEEEYANSPEPVIQGAEVQMQQGNDLNRPKQTYPKVAGGDNPMAMAEAAELAAIEKRLMEELDSIKIVSEKYMGFDKTVAAIKKGGSAKNPEAVAASIGRKKYGKEKFQKAAAAGKKLG